MWLVNRKSGDGMKWKYAPEHVLVVSDHHYPRLERVISYEIYPPYRYPSDSPLKKDIVNIHIKTASGGRWVGAQEAKINGELRCIFVPYSDNDEVINTLPDVPEHLI